MRMRVDSPCYTARARYYYVAAGKGYAIRCITAYAMLARERAAMIRVAAASVIDMILLIYYGLIITREC